MRENLFKAKKWDNGKWIEGYFVKIKDVTEHNLILTGELSKGAYTDFIGYEVDPETLCQFTGLTDKNGKRIWENNVVLLVYDGKEHIYQIVWDNSELDFKATNGEENYGTHYEYLLCCEEIEVIGNIFDNPELLQEVRQNEQS